MRAVQIHRKIRQAALIALCILLVTLRGRAMAEPVAVTKSTELFTADMQQALDGAGDDSGGGPGGTLAGGRISGGDAVKAAAGFLQSRAYRARRCIRLAGGEPPGDTGGT
ncbi:hypothetical protein [Paenibacillus tengchongensis]|uniref:hypothetical protein n=1 Tax=Paenibacillus tengchongensis TaxID=2608684 RepID=UPI00124D996E|nr:hypothetical protein [Paenibacillus tengchongensis]